MLKTRNNAWLAYGCLLVLLGLWYIYDELKKPGAILIFKSSEPCKECEESDSEEEQKEAPQEEEDNV